MSEDTEPRESDADPADGTPLEPPREPVPARDALKGVRRPREIAEDEFHPAGSHEASGQETIARLLTYYPFTRLFCSIAHRQFPSSYRPETRVSRLRQQHPKFYGLCVAADFVLVLLSAVLLLGAASIAIYKTLWLGT